MDFEPYDEFMSAEETKSWIRAWTGNNELDGAEYRVFGQDGTGGYAAIWCVKPEASLLGQPIVFLGSEGETGVVAQNFAEYLWLLAGGLGPYEAVAYPEEVRPSHPVFTAFATQHSGIEPIAAGEVLTRAKTAFPSFSEDLRAQCRYEDGDGGVPQTDGGTQFPPLGALHESHWEQEHDHEKLLMNSEYTR